MVFGAVRASARCLEVTLGSRGDRPLRPFSRAEAGSSTGFHRSVTRRISPQGGYAAFRMLGCRLSRAGLPSASIATVRIASIAP